MASIRHLERWKTIFRYVMSMSVLLILLSCRHSNDLPSSTSDASTDELILTAEMKGISVWAAEADRQTAEDILSALQSNSEEICADLQTACQFSVTVEVYPGQADFDQHVINSDMRSFLAISRDPSLIQMVSPANPSPHKISYRDGTLVAVHEFAHLALNEVNSRLPAWLEEGTAVYVGPHRPYTMVCRTAFPFEMTPSLQQLMERYDSVPAGDLFAYTAVEFIAQKFGLEKLNMLLRAPDDFEDVLGISQADFEEHWHRFIRTQYHNYRSEMIPVVSITCVVLCILGAILVIRSARQRRKGI